MYRITKIFSSVAQETITAAIRVDRSYPNKQILIKGVYKSQQCRGKAENML